MILFIGPLNCGMRISALPDGVIIQKFIKADNGNCHEIDETSRKIGAVWVT